MTLPGNTKIGPADRPAARDAVATLYRNGASVRQVARRFGLSYGLAHRLLTEAGVTFRSRGGYNPGGGGEVEL